MRAICFAVLALTTCQMVRNAKDSFDIGLFKILSYIAAAIAFALCVLGL